MLAANRNNSSVLGIEHSAVLILMDLVKMERINTNFVAIFDFLEGIEDSSADKF